MRLIRIGRRIVNIDRVTDAEYVRAGEIDFDDRPATEDRCRLWFSNHEDDLDYLTFTDETAQAAWALLNTLVRGCARPIEPEVPRDA